MINFFLIFLLLINGNTFSKDIKQTTKAIQIVESENNPNAIGDTKYYNYSVGLGQIRLKTGVWIINNLVSEGIIKKMLLKDLRRLGIKKILLNPIINTYLTKTYLNWLKKYHKGKLDEAIISYNTGQGAKKYIRNNLGKLYLEKVKKNLNN